MMLGRRAFEPGNDFQSKLPAVFQMRRRRRFTSVVLAEDQRQGEQGQSWGSVRGQSWGSAHMCTLA